MQKPTNQDRTTAIRARQELDALHRESVIEREHQAEILGQLKARYYPDDVPVRELYGIRAMRYEKVRT